MAEFSFKASLSSFPPFVINKMSILTQIQCPVEITNLV